MIAMAEHLLIAMIIAGFGLSGAYLRAVFVLRRRYRAAERKREIGLRELHCHGLCRDEKNIPRSSTVQTEKRVDAKAATPGAITEGELRPTVDRLSRCGERQSDSRSFI
jgi:hypothetical protein